MDEMAGRVAVVTGAAGGIGRAIALRCAAEGMQVVVSDVDASSLDGLVAEIKDRGSRAVAAVTDVSDGEAVQALADTAYDEFGAVHLLCNNAGVMPPGRFRPIWEFSVEDWELSWGVNLMGVVHGIRAFVPRMLEGGEPGHVMNVASIGGLTSGAWSAPYGVAKHGVVRATEALYAGLRQADSAIGVTALLPGLVRSAMAPDAEMSPEAVADQAIQAVRDDTFYVLTSAAYDEAIGQRSADILARRNPTFADIRDLNRGEATPQGDGR